MVDVELTGYNYTCHVVVFSKENWMVVRF